MHVSSGHGFILLHIAAMRNALNCAWILLNQGIDVNRKAHNGGTSLNMYEIGSRQDIFNKLIVNGALFDA